MKRLCALVCMALLVPASYAGVRPLTLADLCKNSTLIVHGTVASRHVRWEGTTIVTDWTIRPFESSSMSMLARGLGTPAKKKQSKKITHEKMLKMTGLVGTFQMTTRTVSSASRSIDHGVKLSGPVGLHHLRVRVPLLALLALRLVRASLP